MPNPIYSYEGASGTEGRWVDHSQSKGHLKDYAPTYYITQTHKVRPVFDPLTARKPEKY